MRKIILVGMAAIVLALGALPALAVANNTIYAAQGDHGKQAKQADNKGGSANQVSSGDKAQTPANAEYKKPCKNPKKLKKPTKGKRHHGNRQGCKKK